MKKISFFLLITAAFSVQTVLGQSGPGKKGELKGEVEKIRKNVYSRVLILSDEEGKNFWPVFEKMQTEVMAVRKDMKKQGKYMMDNYGTLSDDELDKGMQKMLGFEQQLIDIKNKYYPEFKKVLPMKKVVLLQKAEREFKRELLQKYKALSDPEMEDE